MFAKFFDIEGGEVGYKNLPRDTEIVYSGGKVYVRDTERDYWDELVSKVYAFRVAKRVHHVFGFDDATDTAKTT